MTARALTLVLAIAALAGVEPALGAIFPGGVVNAASYTPAGLPGSRIARGSIFLIFGESLADPGLAQAGAFPLPTTLGGASIEVESGGMTLDCALVFTTPGQLAAILPSGIPAGAGVVRVRYSGQTFSEPIQIADSSVGIFAQNASGRGPGSVQNFVSSAETPLNGWLTAANQGQAVIIWTTGLGGVEGPEFDRPLPAAKPAGVSVRVFIDGLAAQVLDFGRSGCCAGLDQIVAIVPPGAGGCSSTVQVVTEAGGVSVTSNTVTIATAQTGSACSDPGGIDASELSSLTGLRTGLISFDRAEASLMDPVFGEAFSIGDGAAGRFVEDLTVGGGPGIPSLAAGRPGSCMVTSFRAGDPGPGVEAPIRFLDAGAPLIVRGPAGREAEIPLTEQDIYFAIFAQGTRIPSLGQGGEVELFLDPGTYTVSGPGGADVGPFTASVDIPELVEWTNRQVETVNRAEGFTVSWSGGVPGKEVVQINGTAATGAGAEQAGVLFQCFADPGEGQFSIPAHILQALPATDGPSGGMSVGTWSLGERFEADGLDFGFLRYTSIYSRGGIEYR